MLCVESLRLFSLLYKLVFNTLVISDETQEPLRKYYYRIERKVVLLPFREFWQERETLNLLELSKIG